MSSNYVKPSVRKPLDSYRDRVKSQSPSRKQITQNKTSEEYQSDSDEPYTEVNIYYRKSTQKESTQDEKTEEERTQEETTDETTQEGNVINSNNGDSPNNITKREEIHRKEDIIKKKDIIHRYRVDNTVKIRSNKNQNSRTKLGNNTDGKTQNIYSQANTYFSLKGIIAVLVASFALYIMCNGQNLKTNEPPPKKNCSFESFKKKYPSEDDLLWKSLKIGIENVLNKHPPMPVVYLFLHDNSSSSQKLVRSIAGKAAKCFKTTQPMELNYTDFTSKEAIADYGIIIQKFLDIVGDGGSLIIPNLNEISGNTARALHSICDTYSPIVSNLAVFMTLEPLKNKEGSNMKIAEDTLEELWGNELARNELDPLIARVTDQVYYLRTN